MSNASITKTTPEWNTINWAKVQRKVFKLQTRIFQAVKSGDKVKAKKLQKLLLKSHYAKLLATRKVTQDNQGKKTAGIDGKKALRPNQRTKLANELRLKGYKAQALRRVWIPKPGREEKRGLGIPTMKDRAMQALVKSALEPYWEAQFEGTSYGLRPGRSAHDAITRIYTVINQNSRYVLDADIAKCFDKINHDYLLSKVDCPHNIKRIIKQWLECGVLDKGIFEETDSGTPQGGVISPLLANIALHGMIKETINKFPKSIKRNGKQVRGYQPKIIRYADDFVVLHEDYDVILQCKNLIAQWLEKVGLKLKPEKTSIRHTFKSIEHDGKTIKPGFDFLGFNIRSYTVGIHHSGKTGGHPNKEKKQRLTGFKTLIKPSKKEILAHHEAIKEVIKANKKAPQAALIARLNPIIRGWCNYYRTVVSKGTFSTEDHIVWGMLRAWTVSRKKKKTPLIKALKKYFSHGKHGIWTFQTKGMSLYYHAETEIKRHTLVKPEASPLDGNWTYGRKRRGTYTGTPTRVAKLLKKQKGICPWCKQHFTPEDLIEVDHIIPQSKGGKDTYNNYQALHRHCHDAKSKNDYLYDWLDNGYEWKDDVLIVPMTWD